jgi:hypothetical protein
VHSLTDVGKRPSNKDKTLWKAWNDWRVGKGLPSWSDMSSTEEFWESKAAKGKKPAGAGSAERALALGEDAEEQDEERGELVRRTEAVKDAQAQPVLRDWCEKFSRDEGTFKEFKMKREVWGWDFEGLRTGEWFTMFDGTLHVARGIAVNGTDASDPFSNHVHWIRE